MKYKNILLVDDDEDDRMIFVNAVQSISADVVCNVAIDGEDALKFLKNNPSPDLIFLDLNMPKITGVDLLKLLRNNPEYKDIAICIYSTGSYLTICQDNIPNEISIIKPNNYTDLIDILTMALEGKISQTTASGLPQDDAGVKSPWQQ